MSVASLAELDGRACSIVSCAYIMIVCMRPVSLLLNEDL